MHPVVPIRLGRHGTYSIVARDPESGELGVAVQSHWFSVGSVVTWARPGVGAVATQAMAEPAYGELALDRLAAGQSPEQALAELVAADPGGPGRQVAVVDGRGRVAAHTGRSCVPFAGHALGDQVSCQANIMAGEAVWPAMLEAFGSARGPLASRLLVALEAGEEAGGDIRGRQSAAILVVPAAGERWETVVSLRVEDDAEPLVELRRLLVVHEAYELADQADGLVNQGRHAEAAERFRQACALAPGNHELALWAGLGTVQVGDEEAGLALVRSAIADQPGWATLLTRMPPEVSPVAARVVERLGLGPAGVAGP